MNAPGTGSAAASGDAAADLPTTISWAELVAQATLGTGRRPQRVGGTVAGQALPTAGTTEQSVLAAAAALGAARRVSSAPQRRPDLPAPTRSPRDELPIAPPRAGQVLEVILGGEVVQAGDVRPLLAAWLQQCVTTGHRVAPELLPRLLPRLTGTGIDPVTAARAVGVRGRWLAGLHPAWADLARIPVDVEPATLQHRLAGPVQLPDALTRPAALAALRRHDRAAAQHALTTLWAAATVQERHAVLAAAAVDLAADDEPWLEAALADRSPAVAQGAAALLDRLPASRRAGRMAARLSLMLEIRRVRLRRQLSLRPPDPPTPEDLRDASEPPPDGGRTVWWQTQIIRGAPVETWQQAAGGIQAALALLRDDSTLLCLVAQAVALQHDAAWQAATLAALLDGVGLGAVQLATPGGPAAAQAEHQARAARITAIASVASSLPQPWDQRTGRALLAWAMTHPAPGSVLAQLRPILAVGLGSDMIDVVREHEGYRGAEERQVVLTLGRLRHILSLRRELTSAFTTADPANTPDPANSADPPDRSDDEP